MDVEQRARELLAAQYANEGRMLSAKETMDGHDLQAHAEYLVLRAIIAALTPPEGYVLVPVQLVEAIRLLAQIYEAGGDIDTKLWEVEDLLDASQEGKQRDEFAPPWQPIETAPRGKWVLVATAGAACGGVAMKDSSWFNQDLKLDPYAARATHWMPFPPPPGVEK